MNLSQGFWDADVLWRCAAAIRGVEASCGGLGEDVSHKNMAPAVTELSTDLCLTFSPSTDSDALNLVKDAPN